MKQIQRRNRSLKRQYIIPGGFLSIPMQMVKKKSFCSLLVVVLGLLLLVGSFNLVAPAVASTKILVTITGDGVENPITLTENDLNIMEQVYACDYSTINTWPTKKWYVAEGVKLSDLLQKAKIQEDARLIKITSIDGFTKMLTREQLDAPRYYFPGLKDNHEYFGYIPGTAGKSVPVDTILALKSVENSNNPDAMNDLVAPLLVMGQRWVTEQTNELFVKTVSTIEVFTQAPGKWDNPVADKESGIVPAGTKLALSTSDMDGDCIHYTTDNTEPTFKSPMFNWVKKRWWVSRSDELAEINKSITVNRSMTVKAIAIGPGKEDSDIITYEYHVTDAYPPALIEDITNICTNKPIEITFPDDQEWADAINVIKVDGSEIPSDKYKVTANKITILPGVFTEEKEYTITISATDFRNASVVQKIVLENAEPPVLIADTINNIIGQEIIITFLHNKDWEQSITNVIVDDIELTNDQYQIESGKVTISAGILTENKDYMITVQALGYTDASVMQGMVAPVIISTPTNSQNFNQGAQVSIKGTAGVTVTSLRVKVTDPNAQVVYGPADVLATGGKFETCFTLSTSAQVGVYTITVDGVGLPGTITSTFVVKAGGSIIVPPGGDVVLTITGSGVAKEVKLTLEDLQRMNQYQQVYSAINTWPTKKWYVGEGVKLKDLLNLAGMTSYNGLIKLIATDGFTATLTVKELLNETRYIFPNFKNGSDGDGHIPGSSAGAKVVEPLIGLVSAEGTDNSAYMNDLNSPLFMLGQRAVTEQNGQLFIKNLSKIEVLTTSPSQWDTPKADPVAGEVPVGTLVKLSNANMDDDKIHYTTDGSTPTINSPMYNWVASRWWPSRADVLETINHPIEIKEDTTIKAITIGPGKNDSQVATFTYKAKKAIANIIEQVIPGKESTISLGTEVTILIPVDALKEAVEVKIDKVATPPAIPNGFRLLGNAYEFSVDGKSNYSFARSITVTLTFDPKAVGESETPSVYYYDQALGEWKNIGGTISGNTITVEVDHFTKFAVMVVDKTKLEELEKPVEIVQLVKLTDIIGHWAQENIEQLVASGAVGGYPDGTFKPDNTITRAEFVTILVKAFKLENKGSKTFADTTSHWAKDYIASAVASGIVTGYDSDTFGPDDMITREQMAVMISKVAKLPMASGDLQFIDSDSISTWARSAIATANLHGIMKGYPDNSIKPQGNATRAEAVTVIVNALKKVKVVEKTAN